MTAGTAVATTREQHPIILRMESRADELRRLLPATLNYDKFSRVVYDALNRDPKLRDCTPASVVNACASAARDGLLLDGKEAALVIYAGQAQYVPMVAGIRKRIFNSGLVSAMQTGVVYSAEIEAGRFEYQEGTDAHLRHAPDMLWSPEPNEDPAAAYSVVKMRDGGVSVEVMKWSEIKRVWALGKRANPLYVTHKIEMARKTVLRRHAKSLPFSSDMFGSDDEPDVIDADEPAPEAAPEAPQARRRGAAAAAVRAQSEYNNRQSDKIGAASVPAHDPETGEVAGDDLAGDDADRDYLPETDADDRF